MPKAKLNAAHGSALDFEAVAVKLVRRLGQPVAALVRGAGPFDGAANRWLEQHLAAAPVQTSIDGVSLPTAALLRGPRAAHTDARGRLHLRAELTAENPALHLARRRVHKSADLLKHVEALKAVVVSSAFAKRFQPIALGGRDRGAIIQDRSDWAELGGALAEYARLETDEVARDATITGGTSADTAGKWVVTWRDPRAYRNHDELAARTVRFADGDGVPGSWGEPLPEWPHAPRAPLIGCVARLFRTFDAGAWSEWVAKDVPLFLEAPDGPLFVVGAVDELRWSGGIPAWHSALEVAHTGVGLPGPLDGIETRAWSGATRVIADTDTQPLIELELPGFEAGSNQFFARRLTPTDGKGDSGENRKVYAGAVGQVEWSGRFDDEAVFAGTRRRRAAEAANLISLDDDVTVRLKVVYVRTCGDLNFDCELNVLVAKELKMRGSTAIIASAGARVEVNEDHVNTVQ
jgi:hypothetical protein